MKKDKPTVLIIDDNFDILDLLELFLYKNYNILTAGNGFEGLNIAKDVIPDCIVTDIFMPVMDGIKFINNVKRSDSIKSVPIIATTSFMKDNTVKSLLNIGFASVVTKPFKQETIVVAVQNAIKS